MNVLNWSCRRSFTWIARPSSSEWNENATSNSKSSSPIMSPSALRLLAIVETSLCAAEVHFTSFRPRCCTNPPGMRPRARGAPPILFSPQLLEQLAADHLSPHRVATYFGVCFARVIRLPHLVTCTTIVDVGNRAEYGALRQSGEQHAALRDVQAGEH